MTISLPTCPIDHPKALTRTEALARLNELAGDCGGQRIIYIQGGWQVKDPPRKFETISRIRFVWNYGLVSDEGPALVRDKHIFPPTEICGEWEIGYVYDIEVVTKRQRSSFKEIIVLKVSPLGRAVDSTLKCQ